MNPKCGPEKHSRRSIRLKGYDYSLAGAYFTTICVKEGRYIFGDIKDGKVVLSSIGEIVQECWDEIPKHFDYVRLDVSVIMPNHLHGIVIITNDGRGLQSHVGRGVQFRDGGDVQSRGGRGVQLNAPTRDVVDFYKSISPKQKTLSIIIRTFKAAVTTQCRKSNYRFPEWQRNYYEHIIRNEDKLNRIREYIQSNPLKWQFDIENPDRVDDKVYQEQWRWLEGMYA